MKCVMCGGKMNARRETRKYTGCGLPNVTLKDVEVRRCIECGEEELAIPRVLDLHKAIAMRIIRKPGRLTGAEVRFLRKFLGWSGADFARRIGAAPETVSRWENGRERLGPTADRFLRLATVHGAPVLDYRLDELDAVDQGHDEAIRLRARVLRKKWELKTA